MIIIAAMSENRVIGSGAGMPWNVPDEYERYVKTVRGQIVIMGRRSWNIFGKDLRDSINIVLTRQPEIAGARVAASLDAALELAEEFDRTVFVAGGASVYEEAIQISNEMYLSTIKGHFEGDSYFPSFNENDWQLIRKHDHPDYVFRHLRLIK